MCTAYTHIGARRRKSMSKKQTAKVEEPVVAFLIGMRVNALLRFWVWLPVAAAMPRMLRMMLVMKSDATMTIIMRSMMLRTVMVTMG
jgi:hypothetical protein